MTNINFAEFEKLHSLLNEAGIPHIVTRLWDGMQIRMYADHKMTRLLDDAIIHSDSHGVEAGLLETYFLGGCDGWETAEQVFKGWKKMYKEAIIWG